ncbi:MFS transporter [Phocaeicola sp.]
MNKEKIAFIPKQYLAVIAVLLAIMMSVLDGTIMNIALPTLAHDFEVAPSTAIWIVNAYQLVITMTLLSFASLGDVHGYRRIFLIGISIFVTASLACALSTSFWMLTASRVIQGFGAACVMSVNTALIRLIYPPQILGRGMGVNAMVVAVSAAAGPSIAGSILALGSWHWLFVINIPLGIAALVIGYRLLPPNPASEIKHKFDKISAIANALTFGLLIYTLEGFAHSENRRFIAIQLVLLVIIGVYYIRRQLRQTTPILPVDLLKIPIFSLSIGTSITSFTAQMLAMVSLPFFMQNVLGYSAVQIGLLLTPWPLATILTAPLAGRLVERVHAGLLGGIGMAVFAAGLFALYRLPAHPEEWSIIWRMALCGMGFGLFQTPNNVTIVSSAPTHRSGGASGMLGTARLLGQTLGTTLVALLFRMFPEGHRSQACLLLALVFAIGAGIVSCLRLTQNAPTGRKKA